MNRVIKFRAWDPSRKKFLTQNKWLYFKVDDNGILYATNTDIKAVEQDLPVMQFTGRIDECDKEIYEGDVVTCHGYYGNLIVKYETFIYGYTSVAAFCLCNGAGETVFSDFDRVEVIGNIYENPDLLKQS